MLTAHQITLVQSTFGNIALEAGQVADRFYARLFELEPSTRQLFHGPMPDQGQKLMQMVATAVMSLERLDELVPAVQDLGRRHVGYGVQPSHYDTVGQALLWALGDALGNEFTPEVRDAWATVYSVLAQTAIQAAYSAPSLD